jgi:glycosyltransferase involved in cell wall biosynthesis
VLIAEIALAHVIARSICSKPARIPSQGLIFGMHFLAAKMKILVLSHEIPSPAASDTLPLYHGIRHLSALYGHDITLISLASDRSRAEDFEYLKSVCSVEDPISFEWRPLKKLLLTAVKTGTRNLPKNLKHGLLVNELDYFYNHRMDEKIKEAVRKDNFDLILSTRNMANYVVDVDAPKIVCPFDAMYEARRQVFENSRGLERLVYGLRHALNRSYEKRIYEKFDACWVVTQLDKELLESLNPRIRCIVVPLGVDVDYFSPIDTDEEPSSLVLLSALQYPAQIANVFYFYNEVFPSILRESPDVKLYIVGRDPVKEIVDLTADPLVSVTGYVKDVRPYMAKSTVFVAPMILGTGMKNKVLEAMSMGKAVVTTTIGAQGIAVRNREHVIVADNSDEFARETVSLLTDRHARATLGANARKLVEEQYSWETVTKVLNESIVNVLSQRG